MRAIAFALWAACSVVAAQEPPPEETPPAAEAPDAAAPAEEDPERGFLPSTGRLVRYREPPAGGDVRVDIALPASIRQLFERVGSVDAVVSCVGRAAYRPLAQLTDQDFALSLSNKLMGQINLVRIGVTHVRDRGSFTLTSGLLSQEPAAGGAALAMVNAGVEAFARCAALELPRGIRITVVSPPWVEETLRRLGMDPTLGLPAATVARSYVDSITGRRTGEVLDARRSVERPV